MSTCEHPCIVPTGTPGVWQCTERIAPVLIDNDGR